MLAGLEEFPGLAAGGVEDHLAQRETRQRRLLGVIAVMHAKHAEQVLQHRPLRPHQAGGTLDQVLKIPGDDEEQKIAFGRRVDENSAEPHPGAQRDLAGRRIVEAFADEQLGGRLLDAAQFVELVALAQTRNFLLRQFGQDFFPAGFAPAPLACECVSFNGDRARRKAARYVAHVSKRTQRNVLTGA